MKITKQHIRQLIREELAELEQEGWGDKSYHYKEPRGKKKPVFVDIPPERKFQSGMAELFQSLVRPIYTEAKAVIPDEATINRKVDEFVKQHVNFTEQFMKAAQFHVENIRSIVQKDFTGPKPAFKEMPDVVAAFEETADKFLKKISQVSGDIQSAEAELNPADSARPPINESNKIKVTFGKK